MTMSFAKLAAAACALACAAATAATQTGSGSTSATTVATTVATTARFYPFTVDQEALSGAPDRSALNGPLDAGSRLYVRDGHFYRVGPDRQPGTADDARVKLFGVNLTFGGNFPDEAGATRIARNLRKLGVNAVRLHHLDSLPSDEQYAPYSILTTGPYPTFNPIAVARLRGLVQALAREGLYIDLNLHVGYRFRPAVDGLPPLDGGAGMPAVDAPIHVYYPRLVELQESYARQLIQALGLKDNPALALVEINNESSLLASWRGRRWNEAVPSSYAPALQRLWQNWLLRKYGSLQSACAAWDGCTAGAQSAAELPQPAQAQTYSTGFAQLRNGVARRFQAVSDTLFGGSATPAGPAPRERDFLQFLAATDGAYYDRIRRVVHAETDALVPVTGTQMAYGGVLNFDSHAHMDYIDEHIYVAHPDYPGSGADPQDWRIPNRTATGDEMSRLLALSLRRDASRPYTVSEFNQPYPNPRGAEMLPLMSLLGALQDWDGLFFFDYTDSATLPAAPSRFSLSGDWGAWALAGQAAQLFRDGPIAPLKAHLEIPLSPADRLAIGADRQPDALEKWLASQRGIVPAQAWRARLSVLPRLSASPAPAHKAASPDVAAPTGGQDASTVHTTPDGAVRYDVTAGRLVLATPRIFGVFGATGTTRIEGDTAWLRFDAVGPGHASVLLTPLDGRTLGQSRHLLMSLGSLTAGTQPGAMPQRPKEVTPYRGDDAWLTLEPDPGSPGPAGKRVTRAPTWLLRTPVELGLAARAGTIRVYPLDGSGRRREALPSSDITESAGATTLRLQTHADRSSPWYEIVYTE